MPLVFEIARQTFSLQVRGRIYCVLIGLAVAFACLFFFVPPRSERLPGREVFEIAAYFSVFFVVVPFISLFLAVQAVHGDLEDRTSVYLFTRPISRATILFGKWLAAVLLGAIYVVVALTALYVVIAWSGREWRHGSTPSVWSYGVMTTGGLLAVVGYSAMGCLFAAYFRRPLLISTVYIALQMFAARLPIGAGVHAATVDDSVRRFALAHLEEPSRAVTKILGGHMGPRDAADAVLLADPLPALCKLVVVVMVAALLIYSRREYDSRPRE